MLPRNILVVDDSPTTGTLIEMCLQSLGYSVTGIAVSAEQALQMVEDQTPDLVLMDINLGEGTNGIEAADTIMNRHAVPVVYVTAYSDEHTLEAAKQSMPHGFINKPFRAMDLKVNIEIALARAADARPQALPILPESSIGEPKDRLIGYEMLSEALDHLVSGVIMIDEQLQVIYCNRAATKMLGEQSPLTLREKYLDCTSPRTRRDLIRSVSDKTSMMFTLNHQATALHFLLFPLSATTGDDQPVRGCSVLFLFDTANDSPRVEDLVRTLYKLSPTEAKIVSLLVFNPHLPDVAARLGISYQTARTHLKRIYQKTGTNRLPALIQKIVTGPAGLLIHSLD